MITNQYLKDKIRELKTKAGTRHEMDQKKLLEVFEELYDYRVLVEKVYLRLKRK